MAAELDEPTGIPTSEVVAILAVLEAFGEIMNHPRPNLDAILEKAQDQLLGRRPPGPPGPPPEE